MNKIKKILPELRFPEFKDAGEWEEKKLGEILIKNSTKNKKQKYSLVQSVSNKFGLINQEEYFENRRIAGKDTSNYYVIKKGYFAYNPSRIDVGSLAYKYDNETSIISPLYVSFKADSKLVLDYFLLNWFDSENFTKQMIFEGGVRNTLNYESLIQIKILLPPSINEQQRIAACLSSLDELITTAGERLNALKAHKKGLLQRLFPREGSNTPELRFAGFKGAWKEKRLGEVANVVCGGSPRPIDEYLTSDKDGLNWLKIGDISSEAKYITSTSEKVKQSALKKTRVVREGELILSNSMSFGRPYILKISTCIHDGWIAIKDIKNETFEEFLHYFISSEEIQKYFKSKVAGGVVKNLKASTIQDLPILFPSLPEQQKIASCLSSLDTLIEAQQERIALLKTHKKGLLQQLFPHH